MVGYHRDLRQVARLRALLNETMPTLGEGINRYQSLNDATNCPLRLSTSNPSPGQQKNQISEQSEF